MPSGNLFQARKSPPAAGPKDPRKADAGSSGPRGSRLPEILTGENAGRMKGKEQVHPLEGGRGESQTSLLRKLLPVEGKSPRQRLS